MSDKAMKRFLVPGLLLILVLASTPMVTSQTEERREIAITISGFSFSPNVVEVLFGENVTFVVTNQDSASHTFSSEDAGQFNTGTIAGGSTVRVNWTAPLQASEASLDVDFQCNIHTSMKGSIKVVEQFSDPSDDPDPTDDPTNSTSTPDMAEESTTDAGQASLVLPMLLMGLVTPVVIIRSKRI